jgi:hypothetical protein
MYEFEMKSRFPRTRTRLGFCHDHAPSSCQTTMSKGLWTNAPARWRYPIYLPFVGPPISCLYSCYQMSSPPIILSGSDRTSAASGSIPVGYWVPIHTSASRLLSVALLRSKHVYTNCSTTLIGRTVTRGETSPSSLPRLNNSSRSHTQIETWRVYG